MKYWFDSVKNTMIILCEKREMYTYHTVSLYLFCYCWWYRLKRYLNFPFICNALFISHKNELCLCFFWASGNRNCLHDQRTFQWGKVAKLHFTHVACRQQWAHAVCGTWKQTLTQSKMTILNTYSEPMDLLNLHFSFCNLYSWQWCLDIWHLVYAAAVKKSVNLISTLSQKM